MMSRGNRYLGQHRHQAIIWTNVDLSSVRSSDIHLRASSQEIPQPSTTEIMCKDMSRKIIQISQGPMSWVVTDECSGGEVQMPGWIWNVLVTNNMNIPISFVAILCHIRFNGNFFYISKATTFGYIQRKGDTWHFMFQRFTLNENK